jgi:N-acetylglucosaminyl-diphospho-decaprenol L-rhamnosyltransferase
VTTASVAAVVVNYNAASYLEACLASLAANGVGVIVVVDNGSSDDSREVVEASGARWVETGTNLGYGRAANWGAQVLEVRRAEHLFICNPDIRVGAGTVAGLAAALDAEPNLALVGPRLCNPDGSLYPSARRFPDLVDSIGHGLLGMIAPHNRFTRRYRLLDWDHRQAAHVDWVSGACFLARREAWDAVGGFDPSYFMYMEDVDLCWRLRVGGWAVGYEPAAEVMHVQGASTNRRPYRMLGAHHRSMWRFAWRTTTGPRRAALPLVAVGLGGRFVVATLDHRLGHRRAPSLEPTTADPSPATSGPARSGPAPADALPATSGPARSGPAPADALPATSGPASQWATRRGRRRRLLKALARNPDKGDGGAAAGPFDCPWRARP